MISLVRYKTSNSRSPSFRDAFFTHKQAFLNFGSTCAKPHPNTLVPFYFWRFKKRKMTSIQIFALLNSLRVVSILSRPSLLWWRQSAFVQQRGLREKTKQKRDVPWRTNRFNRLRWTRKTHSQMKSSASVKQMQRQSLIHGQSFVLLCPISVY